MGKPRLYKLSVKNLSLPGERMDITTPPHEGCNLCHAQFLRWLADLAEGKGNASNEPDLRPGACPHTPPESAGPRG